METGEQLVKYVRVQMETGEQLVNSVLVQMETGEQLVNSVLGLFYEPTYETATYDLISTSPDGVRSEAK